MNSISNGKFCDKSATLFWSSRKMRRHLFNCFL